VSRDELSTPCSSSDVRETPKRYCGAVEPACSVDIFCSKLAFALYLSVADTDGALWPTRDIRLRLWRRGFDMRQVIARAYAVKRCWDSMAVVRSMRGCARPMNGIFWQSCGRTSTRRGRIDAEDTVPLRA